MSWQAVLLGAVHERPGVARNSVARELGLSSGFATETTARLVASALLAERPAPPTGSRGRPTTSLHPHPDGPLVAVAAIAHGTWRVAAVQLGGTSVAAAERPHQRGRDEVLTAVAAELGALHRRFPARIQAVAVAVPGTVVGSRLVSAPNLGWHDVDLSVLWPRYGPDENEHSFIAGNDATFAAVAEARRGAGAGAGTLLHLYVDAGVGGALIDGGRTVRGANGMAGEFGHMPFGSPAARCRCGALGCWNTSLDGRALARALHRPVPVDEAGFIRDVVAAGRAGRPQALGALADLGRSLGRGTAGLVNALDPHLVTIGGLGRDLMEVAGSHVTRAYLDGLMTVRVAPPPPFVPAQIAGEAPLIGAAEEAFARLLTDEGLSRWAARPRPEDARWT
ncbi:MAG TPA: ROK family protein [Streptosporangiaceae bacterium]|nr:ROK family protein [Streptosporangiaceae bacterium]